MQRTPIEIATELFEDLPNGMHSELTRWLVVVARVHDPVHFEEILLEYRLIQARNETPVPAEMNSNDLSFA